MIARVWWPGFDPNRDPATNVRAGLSLGVLDRDVAGCAAEITSQAKPLLDAVALVQQQNAAMAKENAAIKQQLAEMQQRMADQCQCTVM